MMRKLQNYSSYMIYRIDILERKNINRFHNIAIPTLTRLSVDLQTAEL